MGILEAAEMLLGRGFQPDRTVYLAFGHDEEVGGRHGAAAIAKLLEQRGVRPAFILDEGGADHRRLDPGSRAPRRDGRHGRERGPERRAGGPERGGALLDAARARRHRQARRRHPEARGPPDAGAARRRHPPLLSSIWRPRCPSVPAWRSPTSGCSARSSNGRPLRTRPPTPASAPRTAPTIFQAGIKENVLPHEARAVVNFRILPGDTIQGVLQPRPRNRGPRHPGERHGQRQQRGLAGVRRPRTRVRDDPAHPGPGPPGGDRGPQPARRRHGHQALPLL